MRRVNLPEDLEEPNDAFFNRQIVDLVLKQAGTQLTTDWHTFSEPKHEGLYVKLRELANILLFKGAKGYFWLVTPPEINELLETNYPKKYSTVHMEQLPLGCNCVLFMGTFDKRWRMYADSVLTDTVVMGATFSKKAPAFYGTLKLEGFGKPKPEKDSIQKTTQDGFFPIGPEKDSLAQGLMDGFFPK